MTDTKVAATMTATPGAVAHSRMISSALGHLGDLTAYGAGLRISEVCPLQVDRLDPKRRLIHVRGKGGRDRFVALPARRPHPPCRRSRAGRSCRR